MFLILTTNFIICETSLTSSNSLIQKNNDNKENNYIGNWPQNPIDPEYSSNIFIDCPPSLSLLTIMALVASKSLIVPLQTEFFALEGLTQLMKTIERIKNNLNPELIIKGILLTMYDKRNKLSSQVEKEARGYFKGDGSRRI